MISMIHMPSETNSGPYEMVFCGHPFKLTRDIKDKEDFSRVFLLRLLMNFLHPMRAEKEKYFRKMKNI